MDDERAHLSLSEVRRALDRLRPADIVRLSLLARHWAGGLGRRDADDLLNEAFDRVLSGRRPWPSQVPMPAFFNGVMRSIASQWRHEDDREPLIEDDEEGATEKIDGGITSDHDMNDLLSRMRQALAADPQARDILEHILVDSDREEAQVALGHDATGYDTVRRRMIRHMFTAFNSGWAL
jgi:DNA-directed RNA polymerase specialized sigma24 family protein